LRIIYNLRKLITKIKTLSKIVIINWLGNKIIIKKIKRINGRY